MLIWILGILKAGGAYVPIDPNSPASRISYLLNDLCASFLLTTKAIKARLPGSLDLELIEIDKENTKVSTSPTKNPHFQLHQIVLLMLFTHLVRLGS
ncbi:hypothetical protein SAE01_45820 [Segetibacter aerophilus]|uniref:AMP-dependent synthetase/ligase domain-containing protein n=2 Tax=Segetibacter aerophilus TaxID=670293 RepID=A0A512BJE1_9BACT|nr:hypothetical protein SAE01_45820 [Segetibacter aerophilus]